MCFLRLHDIAYEIVRMGHSAHSTHQVVGDFLHRPALAVVINGRCNPLVSTQHSCLGGCHTSDSQTMVVFSITRNCHECMRRYMLIRRIFVITDVLQGSTGTRRNALAVHHRVNQLCMSRNRRKDNLPTLHRTVLGVILRVAPLVGVGSTHIAVLCQYQSVTLVIDHIDRLASRKLLEGHSLQPVVLVVIGILVERFRVDA